ncbi:MAG: type III-B CRISPR module-associated protein Cmr3 [Thermodesulfovibrionales bacterium]
MKTTTLLLRPLDVLHLRGNRLFGGAGDHGEALMPPWPSAFAGAVLSRALADSGRLQEALKKGNGPHIVRDMFGRFSLRWMALTGNERRNQLYFPVPADLVVRRENGLMPERIVTIPKEKFLGCGLSLPEELAEIPAIRSASKAKAEGGYWLTIEGLERHLEGKEVNGEDLILTEKLWKIDPRLGIAMNPGRRTAEEGKIYTTEAVALAEGVGFACAFSHEKGDLPKDGLVRLGGDGRGATVMEYPYGREALGKPAPGWKRFRMIFATPCPSKEGWLPPLLKKEQEGYVLTADGLRARMVSAAVPRYEVVSGWDVAKREPKPAVRMIPAGSVYWFETIEGDTSALVTLWEKGLIIDNDDRAREGFGRVWFAIA